MLTVSTQSFVPGNDFAKVCYRHHQVLHVSGSFWPSLHGKLLLLIKISPILPLKVSFYCRFWQRLSYFLQSDPCHMSVKTFFTKEKDSPTYVGIHLLSHWYSGRLYINTVNFKSKINSRRGYSWYFFVKCQKFVAVPGRMILTSIFPSDWLMKSYIVKHK